VTEISRDDIVYSGGVIAVLVIMAVGFFAGFMFSNLDDTNELSVLRLELDLNQARDEGFANGFNQASFLCQRDVNALVAQCQGEVSAIVAECNSRLEACEE